MYNDEPTMMGPRRANASVVVRQGVQAGMRFPILAHQVVLGREESTDITLQDPEASRRHALISWQGGQYVIEDLGSTNGTFVNGVQITGPQTLQPGDSIGIGQTTLVFHLEGEQARRPPSAPMPQYAAAQPEGRSKTTQYLLYGVGCLLFLCICSLLAGATALLLNPDLLNQVF
ncbi:MAG: FHA domain-containing protein [Chloroflexi bacterium]|nr:MAG: FHA domain-containing protein [Chloroflexota bacterium]